MNQYSASATANYFDGAGFSQTNLVSGIVQGNGDDNRIGDRIQLLGIRVWGYIDNQVGATANAITNSRVLVFQFFSDSANAPVPGSMLLSSSANAGTTYGTWSFEQIDRIYQYRIVHDTGPLTTLGSNAVAVTGSPTPIARTHKFNFDVNLSNVDKNVTYFAAGANGPNHLYLLILSDQATIATNPSVFFGYRVRFIG